MLAYRLSLAFIKLIRQKGLLESNPFWSNAQGLPTTPGLPLQRHSLIHFEIVPVAVKSHVAWFTWETLAAHLKYAGYMVNATLHKPPLPLEIVMLPVAALAMPLMSRQAIEENAENQLWSKLGHCNLLNLRA